MTQILRASVQVVAVLGIACLIVFLVAATLFALQKTYVSNVQDVTPNATGQRPSNVVGSNTAARPSLTVQSRSQAAAPPVSNSESENLSSASEPSTSRSELPITAVNTEERSTFEVVHDETSETDNKPLVASESVPAPTPESPPTRNTSSETASENSESTQPVPVTSSVQYYTVKDGDTLYGIARRFYGEGRHWRTVYNANRDLINEARNLKLGWKLELPPLESVVAEN